MCELFALTSQIPTRATFSLQEFSRHGGQGGSNADGWGLAFYDGPDAQVYREPRPACSSEWMDFILHHPHRSRCIISHIRRATRGDIALRNTQPFSRALKGRRHVFCHNGDLASIQDSLQPGWYSPLGETDSEYAFCWLMDRVRTLWEAGSPPLAARIKVLGNAFTELSALGPANILYSDSEYLYAFANRRTQSTGLMAPPGMHYQQRHCEFDADAFEDAGVLLQGQPQDIVLFASVPLSAEQWLPFEPDQLVVSRDGHIVWSGQL